MGQYRWNQGPELYFSASEIKVQFFLPCGQECDLSNWALSLSLGSFILSVVKSKGGERVVEIWPISSERQKGNLGQRKLFNFFGLLKLLTGEQTDVTTYHQLHAIKYIACLCRCPESFLFIHAQLCERYTTAHPHQDSHVPDRSESTLIRKLKCLEKYWTPSGKLHLYLICSFK